MSTSEGNSIRNDFMSVLLCGLETKDVGLVRQYLSDSQREEEVAACAFEALRPVHQAMVKSSNDPNFYYECIDWLMHLGKVGTPKEILLGLLEIIEEEGSLLNCAPLILLLENTLLKLPAKRISALEWTLSLLDKHIQLLPVPKDNQLEGDEKKLLDLDQDIIKICEILFPYISLIRTFVTEVSLSAYTRQKIESRIVMQRRLLIRYLLSVLSYPLAFLDLEHKLGSAKSKVHTIAEECVCCLRQLTGYVFDIYQMASDFSDTTRKSNFELGLPVMAYMILSENVTDLCPSVYEPWFLLETHIKFANLFLSRTETLVVSKGVALVDSLLRKFSVGTLTVLNLDLPELLVLCEKLLSVMIHCPAKDVRTKALQDFKHLTDKFDSIGTCHFLITMLQGHSQPAVQSLLLTMYKDKLDESLKNNSSDNPFIKSNLERVLKIATKLEESKVETDLIDNSSRILSALNLLRYVVLKEKVVSLGVAHSIKKLPEHFLDPLRLALNLSRAHYKKQYEESKVSKPRETSIVETLTVQDQQLPSLPPDYESQICLAAVTTFDLMESVVVRLEENIQESVPGKDNR